MSSCTTYYLFAIFHSIFYENFTIFVLEAEEKSKESKESIKN